MAILPIIATGWHNLLALLSPAEQRCEQCGRLYTGRSRETQRIIYQPLINVSQQSSALQRVSASQYAYTHPTIRSVLASYLPLCLSCQSMIPWKQQIYCLICGRGEACVDCGQRAERYFVCNRSSVQYDDQMKEWLATYKYRGDERLQVRLSAMLMASFYQLTDEVMLRLGKQNQGRNRREQRSVHICWDAITYVPLSETRLVERGFNQAEQLADWLAVQHDIPLLEAVKRVKHSTKMSRQSRVGREENVTDVFAGCEEQLRLFAYFVHMNRKEVTNRVIRLLLVDDVYTTGTTVNACAQAIIWTARQCGLEQVEIYALTWARS